MEKEKIKQTVELVNMVKCFEWLINIVDRCPEPEIQLQIKDPAQCTITHYLPLVAASRLKEIFETNKKQLEQQLEDL